MSKSDRGSASFVRVDVNRDALEPKPIEVPTEQLVHENVCESGVATEFSKSRGHPVYVIDLPTRAISATVGELEEGQKTSNHRHAYESLIYALEGEGYTVIEGQRVNWRAGDAFYVPPWNWHQHFAVTGRVRYLTATNLPMLHAMGQTVLRQEEH